MDQDCLKTLRSGVSALWHRHGRETPVPGLFVVHVEEPAGPFHSVYEPSLCIILQGAKISRLGDSVYRYDAGKCLITSLEVPIRAEIVDASKAAPYVAMILNIDPAMVAELLLEQARSNTPPAAVSAALGVHPLPDNLINPLERLVALCGRPQDIPVLAPMICREIVWYLLSSPQGVALRQIGLADSRTARIGQAIAWLREHFTESISVPHLAALAGMSPATFHRHFKAATAMTPVQFQKSLRLQEARQRLLANGADVAQIGFAIGYDSPSQFSREYRRMFGAPPGRDGVEIRRLMTSENFA